MPTALRKEVAMLMKAFLVWEQTVLQQYQPGEEIAHCGLLFRVDARSDGSRYLRRPPEFAAMLKEAA